MVAAIFAERRLASMPAAEIEELKKELGQRHSRRQVGLRRGVYVGDRLLSPLQRRFKGWVRGMVVEAMHASIAAMFYACDYATKPNMVCAPLLVAIRDGLQRLESSLEAEREEENQERLACRQAAGAGDQLALDRSALGSASALACSASGAGAEPALARRGRAMTKLEREASRRLIRLATAAHSAQVKGNYLMVMQLLTRR